MNKLKLYEAMNLIDDELVKEAEMPIYTVFPSRGFLIFLQSLRNVSASLLRIYSK